MNRLLPKLAITVLVIGAAFPAFASEAGQGTMPPRLPYDLSAYELLPPFGPGDFARGAGDLKREIRARVAREKARRELDVYYYRIGYTMGFKLPLAAHPSAESFPKPISTLTYPWMVWLSWELEERWRLLHAAWRDLGDQEAGRLLQSELAALSGWSNFREFGGNVGLVTGHVAACLSLALANTNQWDPELLAQARRAAQNMIERDVWPWFQTQWPSAQVGVGQLANIPVIALVRSAQLAQVIGHPHAAALAERSRAVLRAWCQSRAAHPPHTEGAAYDGYLLDSMTEWIDGLPDAAAFRKECQAAFRTFTEQCVQLALPGRADLLAPLGDVEPEMVFWATVLARFDAWYGWKEAHWIVSRVAMPRLRAAALITRLRHPGSSKAAPPPPNSQPAELPNALVLRTGWDRNDALAATGFTRENSGHLHSDAGHLILGWQGRCWISDPGYQQYRPGDERGYTLGSQAHNVPVINGNMPARRAARASILEPSASGKQHIRLELGKCYSGLPPGATVQRDVWLVDNGARAVVARDRFAGLGTNATVVTSWLGAHHLAWAFVDGWIRLSDGRHALWIGSSAGPSRASDLTRHPGTRGPLTFAHTRQLPEGRGDQWWAFVLDPEASFTPPALEVENSRLRLSVRTSHPAPTDINVE